VKVWQVIMLVGLGTALAGVALAQLNSPRMVDFLVALAITLLTLRWIDISRRPRI